MKRGVKLIVVAFVVVLCIVTAIKIIQINRTYPQVQVQNIDVGKTEEMKDGICMQVEKTKWLSKNEAEKAYGEDFKREMEKGINYRTIEVTVNLTNQSNKEQEMDLYDIYFENDIYCNGLVPEIFGELNGNADMGIRLTSGEEKQVILGYLVYEKQFTGKQWKNLETTPFYLANQRYPVKKRWAIN